MRNHTSSDIARQALAALRILLVFTVVLGVIYPAAVWVVGRAFGDRADGQPITVDGQVVGSRLLGQSFEGEQWFHSRPSPNDYDTLASAPSNLGPSNPDLLTQIAERKAEVARTEGVPQSEVPADALTGSGSGLDPHISPEYAQIQAARVARVNGLSVEKVRTFSTRTPTAAASASSVSPGSTSSSSISPCRRPAAEVRGSVP